MTMPALEQGSDPTRSWRFLGSPGFAITAGILAPIFCLALQDSIVGDLVVEIPGLRFLTVFRIFNYGVIALEMVVLLIWLACGPRLGPWSGPISGALFAGALFSGVLGLVLLPFSMIGLLVIIGVLGFVPFLTSAAYYSNGSAAYRQARAALHGPWLHATVLLGALLVLGIPGAAQSAVSLTVRAAIRGVAAGDPTAMAKLRAWGTVASEDRLVWAYEAERDPTRKQRLADAYQSLTGADVEARLDRLRD
ncbi:hypothetical protein [Aquisphaera insulae]|uniref:hypothetical protein n=1 Tax=Aquisphaera insulae TaxID=2712864 RepID=UPI0013E9F2DA|nr:hypothetical protein [Aquisphaera insulae]